MGCQGKFKIPAQWDIINCDVCYQQICSICLRQSHSGNCQDIDVIKAREVVREVGMDIRRCPHCGQYATKDFKYQYTICSGCKRD